MEGRLVLVLAAVWGRCACFQSPTIDPAATDPTTVTTPDYYYDADAVSPRVSPTLAPDCDGARVCCHYQVGTPEFDACCFQHNCCPICDQTYSGCCYNDTVVPYGTVLESFPEACVSLVCAYRLLPAPNEKIVAVLTLYRDPSVECAAPECEDCLPLTCLDERYRVRPEGSEWHPSKCQVCHCVSGLVECRRLEVVCLPKPHDGCVEQPGPCCPTWKCPKQHTCTDHRHQPYDLYSRWTDPQFPCLVFECLVDGIKSHNYCR